MEYTCKCRVLKNREPGIFSDCSKKRKAIITIKPIILFSNKIL